VLGSLALFAGTFILLPFYGLSGVLAAQICQAIVVLFVSWMALQQIMPALHRLPLQWRPRVVKELFSYGAQVQLISVLVFFSEPITKFIMSSFGGLDALALFEMANRLVGQTRSLIVSANQSLIPAYTDLSTRKSSDLFSLFEKNVRYTTMSVVAFCASRTLNRQSLSIRQRASQARMIAARHRGNAQTAEYVSVARFHPLDALSLR
jgi:O-antigen/teichoic acid export membrane protein